MFAQYRDQVKAIVGALRENGFSAERFVGKKEGVTADEQKRTIARFSAGEFDVMVATSIGEEGLDIPSVDTVVFFEPIPSEIRSIQRRGRAGRLRAGRVVVLITTGTRDEAYFHSSRKKEENMKRIVGRMQRQFSAIPKKEGLQKETPPAESAADAKHTKQPSPPRETATGQPSSGKAGRQSSKKRRPAQKKLTDF